MIVTRFAPTTSGKLHIGGLYNALLNYVFARQHNGSFKVRFDGPLNEQRKIWCDHIIENLLRCGLAPDELYYSADHTEEHLEAFRQLLDQHSDRLYFCDCTPNDVAARNLFGFSEENSINLVTRPEKYPPPCRIQCIELHDTYGNKVFGVGDRVINYEMRVSTEDPQHPVSNIEDRTTNYWDPYPRGTGNTHILPEIFIEFAEPVEVASIAITWHDYPVLSGVVRAQYQGTWHEIYSYSKAPYHFIETREAVPYPPHTTDIIHIAPVKSEAIAFRFTRFAYPLMKPYHYDRFCRDQGKQLDLTDAATNVRIRYEDVVEEWGQKPVSEERIPRKYDPQVDSCIWFNGRPDLVFTSPFDDIKLGTTHAIRGIDIYPFFWIEAPVAALLNTSVKSHIFHGMVVNEQNVKYSKFAKSVGINTYLDQGLAVETLLTVLCQRAGIYTGKETLNLQELVDVVDFANLTQKDIVFEWRPTNG